MKVVISKKNFVRHHLNTIYANDANYTVKPPFFTGSKLTSTQRNNFSRTNSNSIFHHTQLRFSVISSAIKQGLTAFRQRLRVKKTRYFIRDIYPFISYTAKTLCWCALAIHGSFFQYQVSFLISTTALFSGDGFEKKNRHREKKKHHKAVPMNQPKKTGRAPSAWAPKESMELHIALIR